MTVIFRITSQRPRKKNLCYFKWISAIFLAKSCFGAEILMLKMTVIFGSASQPPRKKNSAKKPPAENDRHFQKGVSAAEKKKICKKAPS